MLLQEALLVKLVKLVDRIPETPTSAKRGRGRPKVYADRLIVKAVVIMVIRRLYTAYDLLAFLEQPHTIEEIVQHRFVFRPGNEGVFIDNEGSFFI